MQMVRAENMFSIRGNVTTNDMNRDYKVSMEMISIYYVLHSEIIMALEVSRVSAQDPEYMFTSIPNSLLFPSHACILKGRLHILFHVLANPSCCIYILGVKYDTFSARPCEINKTKALQQALQATSAAPDTGSHILASLCTPARWWCWQAPPTGPLLHHTTTDWLLKHPGGSLRCCSDGHGAEDELWVNGRGDMFVKSLTEALKQWGEVRVGLTSSYWKLTVPWCMVSLRLKFSAMGRYSKHVVLKPHKLEKAANRK